jgi:glycosyltransferase involved in cell wall biosynthesis
MKILFYNHTGKVSGAERVLLMILQGLEPGRFESVLLCPSEGPLQQLATESGVSCESVPALDARFTVRPDRLFKYFLSFVGVISQLRRQVKVARPDLVHANSIRSGLVATTATLGLSTRVVWHLHDLLPKHPLSIAIRCFAFLFVRTQMIAVSQAVADKFAGGLFSLKNRIKVILNGLDVDRFTPSDVTRAAKRKEVGLRDEEFAVGIVGLLTPRKGQLELLHAFKQVTANVPHAVLLIAGSAVFNRDGEYEQLLRNTVVQLGLEERVHFLGERSDVPELMQSFDTLVVNSSVEPFGLVVIEGMASEKAVIASRTGGIPEIIQHGRSGWLVTPGEISTLAEAIATVATNTELRTDIAKQGRLTVEKRFTQSRFLTDIQEFYEHQQGTETAMQNLSAGDLRKPRLLAEQE